MNEWFTNAVRDAVSSTFRWGCTLLCTLVVGFCAGYWIGHREIVGPWETFKAFSLLPFLWLGYRQVIIAYAVTLMAWYFPLRFESLKVRVMAALVNVMTWFVVILWIVEISKNEKFFHF